MPRLHGEACSCDPSESGSRGEKPSRLRFAFRLPRPSKTALQGVPVAAGKRRERMATWNDVSKIALALPGVVEEPWGQLGTKAWKVAKKGFVWERPLRKSDLAALGASAPKGAILGVRTADLEMKEALLKNDPAVFFTTPHFDGYPAVLVRLGKVGRKQLERVIVEAWLARAPKRAAADFLARRKS